MYDFKGQSSIGLEVEYFNKLLTENGIEDGFLNPIDFLRITDVEWFPDKKLLQFTCDIYTNIIN